MKRTLLVGLTTFRDSVVQEMGDTAMAAAVLNQSYSMTTDLDGGTGGQQTTRMFEFGHIEDPGNPPDCEPHVEVTVQVFDSNFTDNNDFCDNTAAGTEGQNVAEPAGAAPACIVVGVGTIVNEGTAPPLP